MGRDATGAGRRVALAGFRGRARQLGGGIRLAVCAGRKKGEAKHRKRVDPRRVVRPRCRRSAASRTRGRTGRGSPRAAAAGPPSARPPAARARRRRCRVGGRRAAVLRRAHVPRGGGAGVGPAASVPCQHAVRG